jgi:hypothetical protein
MTQAGILRHLVNQAVLRRGLPPLPAPSPITYAEAEEAEANEEAVSQDRTLHCGPAQHLLACPRQGCCGL